jgi:Acetoacetate decarboxylase (ADC)
MPQFGRGSAPTAVSEGPASAAPAPWEIKGVIAQMATFEVDVDAVLDLLPPMLSRPAPPYARLLVLDYPDTPVGAYREALLLISARFAMLPRHYVAASVVTSEAARDANLANWHYQSEVGEVSLVRDGSSFTSFIRLASGLEIRVTSADAQEAAPAIIRYDPMTVAWGDASSGSGLITVSAEPMAVSQAWLAVGTTLDYTGGDRQSAWLRLRSRNPITCTIALQDSRLPEPRPVSSTVAMGGGLP